MDFAAEPVLDAFTPPPRAASRPAASEAGPSFDEHLDAAVNDTAPETPPRAEPDRPETHKSDAQTAEAPAIETHEAVDADTALLGGPSPAPPVIAAPLIVQIAAAPPVQQAEAAAPATAPTIAPQAPASVAPMMEAAAPATPSAPAAPKTAKSASAEAKSAAPAAPAPPTPAPAQRATAETAQAASPAAPSAPAPAVTAPIASAQLPPAVQQAIAALAPAPQPTAQPAQRAETAIVERSQAKPADELSTPKHLAAPNANAKTQTAKAVAASAAGREAPMPQTQATAPEAPQTQPATLATPASQASAHVQQTAADSGAQRAAPAAAQVAREIIRRFDGGATSFELRLDPPELGRVEVRMEVTRDHRVTAVIAADSPQALTELARHARELEAQLQSAGLQLGDNGLSFDLRQNARGEAQESGGGQRAGGEDAPIEQAQTPAARPIGLERWRGVRVDMMV